MSVNLGLNETQTREYWDLLCSHHTVEVKIQMLMLDHKPVGGDISSRLIDGQVTYDSESAVTRGLDLDLLDPTHSLHLDSTSPDDGAMFADRLVQVKYDVINPAGTRRYSVPLFTGPLTKVERSGAIVKLEAQGKEIFGLAQAWNEKTFKKGLRTISVIGNLLNEVMGEAPVRMKLPGLTNTLPRNVSVGGDRTPWAVAKELAASLGYQLFYDGTGTARMRKEPASSVFTFYSGAGGSVKSETDVGFDVDNLVNAVEVWGKQPQQVKGKTTPKRPHARLVAPRADPLSPFWPDGIGRPDAPRFLPRVIEDDGIETDKEAATRASIALKNGLRGSVDVAYDSLVIPHLEELDVVTCRTEGWAGVFRLRKFAIPLKSEGTMAVGYVKNVKPSAGRIRMRSNGR